MTTPSPDLPIPQPLVETLEWLLKIEDLATARALVRTVSRFVPPDHVAANDYVASVLHRAKAYKEAATRALRTLELAPASSGALFNAAKCLHSAAQPVEAERLMRRVVEMEPGWHDPKIDLAVYVAAQGRVEEAKAMLEELLTELPPGDPNVDVVTFNLGWHQIRHGEFRRGMESLGIGRKLRIWGSMRWRFERPMLTPGADVRGRTVLLCGEGGAGDEMINARFGQVLKERGARTIWVTQPALRSLLSRVPGLDQVVVGDDLPNVRYDCWAPCMDLPRLLQLELGELPSAPYLSPDPAFVAKWRGIIGDGPGLKVGLRWQGNALYEQDLMRSVPFALLAGLAAVPGVTLYSLQRDEGSEERPADSPVIDLGSRLATWDDTAGAVANLDLVISSCTSVPHLAAAMGRPTWLFCPLNCYYIWASPGDASPWYPSVRLFRQQRFGAWDEPYQAILAELAGRQPS